MLAAMSRTWVDAFTTDEIRELREVSNLRGALAIAGTWSMVAAAMVAVAVAPRCSGRWSCRLRCS